MRSTRAFIVVVPFLLASAGAAFGHSYPKTAEPPINGSVAVAPAEVAINFTEGLEPKFSSIEVDDASGQRVDQGDAHAAPDDPKRLSIGVRKLAPGNYKVIWHATAVDTHKTEGNYTFTVQP
jgi:methionine-rich copper-binding protein CopC